jgi:hypothetical protein
VLGLDTRWRADHLGDRHHLVIEDVAAIVRQTTTMCSSEARSPIASSTAAFTGVVKGSDEGGFATALAHQDDQLRDVRCQQIAAR